MLTEKINHYRRRLLAAITAVVGSGGAVIEAKSLSSKNQANQSKEPKNDKGTEQGNADGKTSIRDENFEAFLKEFKPMPNAKAFPESVLKKYEGKVPNQLVGYWRKMGLCGFNEGSFWFTNPDDYTELLEILLEGKTAFRPKECLVFARSAFGHLHIWCERIGTLVISVPELELYFAPPGPLMKEGKRELVIGAHLLVLKPYNHSSIDVMDEREESLLKPAQSTLGALAADECYGFFPALPFGGRKRLENLQKVKLHEHLIMVAQIDSLRIMKIDEFPPTQVE